jgi:Coenzyme PQQ synthesis protein D (PqqD)
VGLQMYRVSDTVRSTHGQDGAIVLDIRQGQMFNVNFVGSRILTLLKEGSAQASIVDEIVQEFGISRDRAENDVQAFLETLKTNHLVESTDQT